MNFDTMTITELKAAVYDELTKLEAAQKALHEQAQKTIQAINQAIMQKNAPPAVTPTPTPIV